MRALHAGAVRVFARPLRRSSLVARAFCCRSRRDTGSAARSADGHARCSGNARRVCISSWMRRGNTRREYPTAIFMIRLVIPPAMLRLAPGLQLRVGVELCSSFLRHAFVLGVTPTMIVVYVKCEAADLDWSEAQLIDRASVADDPRGQSSSHVRIGLWGVPSFRLLAPSGAPLWKPGARIVCGWRPYLARCAGSALPDHSHLLIASIDLSIGSINANRWPTTCVGRSGGVMRKI